MSQDTYLKTPPGIMLVLKLFTDHQLRYILHKCDHIFAGENKNLDILFVNDDEYHRAAQLLQQHGFVIRLSEKVEKYKQMYTGMVDGILYSIHLHREIAWHGIKAVDKQEVYARSQALHPLIRVPSVEDSILIHAGHVLFENFRITERERKYLLQYHNEGVDKMYIDAHARKMGWYGGLKKVITTSSVSPAAISTTWARKLGGEPGTTLYLGVKMAKRCLRALSLQRKGCLISLIGVNGSGKSTLTRKVLQEYEPLTKHLRKQQYYYYFGWEPTFFLTKILSKMMRKKNKSIFQETALNQKLKTFDLKQELLFLYAFGEFYYRYLSHIRPKLRQNHLVITDRYFYDLFGQYPYARNSYIMKLLLPLFPRPDATFHLDIDFEALARRKKTDRSQQDIEENERTALPAWYLLQQQENYRLLARKLNISIMDSSKSLDACARRIIEETWRKML